ncbi:hypothetical protein UWK_02690 [Desulfocapsa sulfexigens DSM 10523]|uniref:TssC1 N-terminal domain-containing protein n=1 Tax=Desulfocapsa sulfexigens (strain DSM 10523 / SB164P1) TaxID=1167006 RepID=M1PS86_DESSD|nr:type VI secretion system contractile sheath large subunit [Desulfocapsa sulfexigens]AGF79226.1 hypothetical protein UWK_02690 [Desulfocapsa sulfexigens DSM 10523]
MEQISIPDFPFSILALAPFTSEVNPGVTVKLLAVDPLDIDQALTALMPSFFLSLPVAECPAGGLHLRFRKMRDFTPDGLLQSQPYLENLLAAHRFCLEAEQQKKSTEVIIEGVKKWPDLPPISLTQKKKDEEEKKSSLESILSMVALPEEDSSVKGATAGGTGFYGALARKILDSIYTDPIFRSLESCWQGLRYLGRHLAEAGGRLSILPISHNNIEKVLDEQREEIILDPPSVILVDQPLSSSERSVQMMTQLASFGQEMLVPVLTWLDASFFQIENWKNLDSLSFLPHHLEKASFARYKGLQNSDLSRWIGLSCNRFGTRFPYGPENRSRLLPFREKEMLWLSSVWGVAALMASRVRQTGWPTGMASSRQICLEDLALALEGSVEQSPLEVQWSESRLEQVSRCGIMALAGWKGRDSAFLAGDVMASTDSSLSYQTLLCRVSHFILWCRDNWQEPLLADELASRLHTAFQLFTKKQGEYPVGDFGVECHDDKGAIQVLFRWIPSRHILPSGQEIVLEFGW